jgi:SPP1 family phage portal protein
MKIEEILKLSDASKQISLLCIDYAGSEVVREPDKWQDQYDGVHNILLRLNKDVGEEAKELPDGTMTEDTRKTVITAKITIPIQKNIVRSAVAFSVGGGVDLALANNDKPELVSVFKEFRRVIEETKVNSFNVKLAKRLFIEGHVAELWYVEAEKVNGITKKKLKSYLMCRENGDEIYPHFNEFGDMDAFTRKYQIKNGADKLINYYTIYTSEKIITYTGSDYAMTEEKNIFGKIPVIYYDQRLPEWSDVQVLIDRLEMIISKLADMNDYFASPTVKSKGVVSNPPSKDDVGKWIQIQGEEINGTIQYGDVDYLVWQNSPETVKFEVELIMRYVNSLTSTPDISFDNVKNLNGSISGVALQTMFLDAILKGNEKQQLVIGEGFTRRINLLKAILETIDVTRYKRLSETDISLNFKSVLPQNLSEIIDILSVARGGEKTISEKTALQFNPLVKDVDSEMVNLSKEKSEIEGGTFNLGE